MTGEMGRSTDGQYGVTDACACPQRSKSVEISICVTRGLCRLDARLTSNDVTLNIVDEFAFDADPERKAPSCRKVEVLEVLSRSKSKGRPNRSGCSVHLSNKTRLFGPMIACFAILPQLAPSTAWATLRVKHIPAAAAMNAGFQIERVQTMSGADVADRKVAAIDSYLRHILSVSLGLRACSEISRDWKDESLLPNVSLDEASKTLRSIEAAAAEVNINPDAAWTQATPLAATAASALKMESAKHPEYCRKMGRLFRVDVSNLQALLASLSARTVILQKDY